MGKLLLIAYLISDIGYLGGLHQINTVPFVTCFCHLVLFFMIMYVCYFMFSQRVLFSFKFQFFIWYNFHLWKIWKNMQNFRFYFLEINSERIASSSCDFTVYYFMYIKSYHFIEIDCNLILSIVFKVKFCH